MSGSHRPVSRRKFVAGTAFTALALWALIAATEALRYPHPGDTAPTAPDPTQIEPAADPRDPVSCPDPVPREGQPRTPPDDTNAAHPLVTSSALYDCPQSFDGAVVRYRGEVIGAVLRRSTGAWLTLNDDVYATTAGPLPAHRDYRGGNAGIGVFVPHDLADEVTHVGGPKKRGDIIEVTGTFHRVDETTGEVAIVRATTGEVTPGEPLRRPALPRLRVAAVVMALIMAAVVAGEHRFLRREGP